MKKSGRAAQAPLPATLETAGLEAQLGHVFADRVLLRTALSHRSYIHETPGAPPVTNERLEFLGDAVLAWVSADYLFRTHAEMGEGELTSLRAALVKAPTLAQFARAINLGAAVLLGRGEEANGGRDREPILAATFEAIIGALALEAGVDVAAACFLRLMIPEAQRVLATQSDKDDKSRFQELAQARLGVTPVYHVVKTEGPAHRRTYSVELRVGDLVVGHGEGPSKQRAEQAAAHKALAEEGWQATPTAP